MTMYIIVDDRPMVTAGYVANFAKEGVPSVGLPSGEFKTWFEPSASAALNEVQGFLIGECADRSPMAAMIRLHTHAPVIAVNEARSLELTLDLFSAKVDDVVRQPIHIREIIARTEAIWRRINDNQAAADEGKRRLKVYF